MSIKKDNLGLYNAPSFLFETTSSTIDEAKKIIQNDAVVFGTSIMSSYQTQGRGQQGKVWVAQKNTSVLQTHIIIPSEYKKHNIHLTSYPQINIVIANSIIKTIQAIQAMPKAQTAEQAKNISLHIKWPNDILLNEKKIAGILTERYLAYAMVSYGINVKYQNEFDDIKNTSGVPFHFLPTCLESHNILCEPIEFYAVLKKYIEMEFKKTVEEIFDFANTMLWKKNECVKFSPHHGSRPFSEKNEGIEKIKILGMNNDGALFVESEFVEFEMQKRHCKHSGHIGR